MEYSKALFSLVEKVKKPHCEKSSNTVFLSFNDGSNDPWFGLRTDFSGIYLGYMLVPERWKIFYELSVRIFQLRGIILRSKHLGLFLKNYVKSLNFYYDKRPTLVTTGVITNITYLDSLMLLHAVDVVD